MKKRMLSLVAVAALLVGALAVGAVPAAATTDGWTAGDNGAGQYKTFAQYDNAYLADLGASAVKGVVPYRKASNDALPWTLGGNWSGTVQASSNAAWLTDGIIRTAKTDDATGAFVSTNRNMDYTWYFVFDLGAKYDLTDFVVASSQSDGAAYLMRGVKIYVSNDLDDPVSDDNLIYSRWDADEDAAARNFHIQPADGKTVTGRYVTFGIKLYKDGLIRLEELAMYGTKHIDWTAGDNGAGQYNAFDQYSDVYLKSLGTSLVEGVVPHYGTGLGALWSTKADNAAYMTDGAIRTAKTDSTTGAFTFNVGANKANRYYTFNLGSKYDLTDFVVASSQTDTAAKYLLHSVKIYVSNEIGTLYDESNLVYSRWEQEVDLTKRNFHIRPTDGKTVTGCYVGFQLMTGTEDKVLRVEELAVYGAKNWTAGDNALGRYAAFDQYNNDYLTDLGTSLVKGVVPHYGNAGLGSLWSTKGTNAEWMTDGAIRTAKEDATTGSFNFNVGANKANRYYTFDLTAKYDLTDFVVASSQTDTASKYLLHSVKIYVSNDISTLYDESSLVYSRWEQEVDLTKRNFHIQPAEGKAITGRYVGFHLMTGADDKVLRVEELAVYGTKNWIAGDNGAGRYATFDQYNNGYLADLGTSLVQGMIPYSGTSNSRWSDSKFQGTSAANGADKLTDGAIRTAKADDTTDKFVSAHRGVEKVQQFTFFLGATHNLTDFVAASSQNDSGENLLRWVKVYVGDNPETLYTDSNLVYSRWDQDVDATDRNFHIQPADGATVTGDLVGFEVQTPSNGLLRIEELAVFGTPVDGVDTLGAQLSDEYNAEAVSADLRMGFAVKAQGVAYQEDGIAGDYTNAKVVVDGKAYKLAKKDGQPLIGALMGVSSLVKDEELVLGTLNADVKTVYAANVYDIAEDGTVTFTARVTDIPNAYFDAEILGRAFVGYVDAKGVTRYIYGEQLSRSVNYFADNAGDVI